MRKLNITIQIEDNDLIEHKVRSFLESGLGNSIIDIRTFPKTDHLKDNKHFNNLVKAKRNAGIELNRFINDNR